MAIRRSSLSSILLLVQLLLLLLQVQLVTSFPLYPRQRLLLSQSHIHPPHLPTASSAAAASSTRLFGLRIRARQRIVNLFGRIRRRKHRKAPSEEEETIIVNGETTFSTINGDHDAHNHAILRLSNDEAVPLAANGHTLPTGAQNPLRTAETADVTLEFPEKEETPKNSLGLAKSSPVAAAEIPDSLTQKHDQASANGLPAPVDQLWTFSNNPTTNIYQNNPQQQLQGDEYAQFVESLLPPNNASFLDLPPLNTTDNLRHCQEFHDKIAHFEPYTERDIALLQSTRLRIVMEGMAASPLEPAVYRAFEILYQDLLPLRVAGRFIFRRLSQVMEECVHARRQEVEVLQNTTGLSRELLEASQFAFVLLIEDTTPAVQEDADDAGIHNDAEHDVVLPVAQLSQSGILASVVAPRLLGKMDEETILEVMMCNSSEDGAALDFVQFVHGLQQCAHQSTGSRATTDTTEEQQLLLLQSLLQDVCVHVARNQEEQQQRRSHRVLDAQRQEYSDRFEAMLEAFAGWKSLVPPPERQGRMIDVLRGCFVGAQNEAVREALRVVYVDHPTMRVAGNTIFALMSALIPTPTPKAAAVVPKEEVEEQEQQQHVEQRQ